MHVVRVPLGLMMPLLPTPASSQTYMLSDGQDVAPLESFRDSPVCLAMIALPLDHFTTGAPLEESASLSFWVERPEGEPCGMRLEEPEHNLENDGFSA